ncbi:MAG: hypothetical protein OIF32_05905 [Campylobacterales bacterium]|nr:hypothetical protein [Campylobacterales bacterium]
MKKLVLFLLATLFLYGDAIDEKIQMLVDKDSYKRHHKLINILFRDRTSFYNDDLIDNVKIVKILKENGLLKIFYKKPKQINTTFLTSIGSEIFIKSLTDILREMGYSYYLTAYMQKKGTKLEWKISYNSDHVIDPVLFTEKLATYNMYVTDISRVNNQWIYNIASIGVTFEDAKRVELKDEKYSLLNPNGEYWLDMEVEATRIKIRKKATGYWYPKVIFFDKDLKILKVHKYDSSKREINFSLSDDVKFIKVSDRYGIDSLKRGITVEVRE